MILEQGPKIEDSEPAVLNPAQIHSKWKKKKYDGLWHLKLL